MHSSIFPSHLSSSPTTYFNLKFKINLSLSLFERFIENLPIQRFIFQKFDLNIPNCILSFPFLHNRPIIFLSGRYYIWSEVQIRKESMEEASCLHDLLYLICNVELVRKINLHCRLRKEFEKLKHILIA